MPRRDPTRSQRHQFSTYNLADVQDGKGQQCSFIEAIYDAYAQGNSRFILDRITDDVDWVNEGPESIPYAGTFKGPKDVERFFQALGSSVDNGRVTSEDFIAQGDKVVATGRFSATVKATGKRIDVPIARTAAGPEHIVIGALIVAQTGRNP